MPSAHPDWLGSPQHLVAGVVLAAAITAVAVRRRLAVGVAVLLGVGLTAAAETVVELVEYPLLYAGEPHVTAYYDTLADLAATLVGAVLGAVAVGLSRFRAAGRSRPPAT